MKLKIWDDEDRLIMKKKGQGKSILEELEDIFKLK